MNKKSKRAGNMEEKGLFKGTVILTLSGVAVKILSAVYKIPLAGLIGPVGMGYYSAAFSIFMPFYSLATAGITPTVSRLCAACPPGDKGAPAAIEKKAAKCFGVISLALIALALVFCKFYSDYNPSPMIFAGVALLCPNLFFATFEAIYKGVSQGCMNMSVTAKANILESGSKVLIGLVSVYAVVRVLRGDTYLRTACAFATVSVCGLICLVYMRQDFKKRYPNGFKTDYKVGAGRLLSMAIPVSLSALVMSLANFYDSAVCLPIIKSIPDSLLLKAYPGINFSGEEEKAMWLYGVYQGLSLSVSGLIPSVAASIGASGLPMITKSAAGNNREKFRRRADRLIKFTSRAVAPAAVFVMLFPSEILSILYGDRGSRITLAAGFLKISSLTAALSSFSFPINSILHAKGKSSLILGILTVGCIVKTALGAFLCGIPEVNIKGCVYSRLAFSLTVYILSCARVKKYAGVLAAASAFAPFALSYIILSCVKPLVNFFVGNENIYIYTFSCAAVFVSFYAVFLFLLSSVLLKGTTDDKM